MPHVHLLSCFFSGHTNDVTSVLDVILVDEGREKVQRSKLKDNLIFAWSLKMENRDRASLGRLLERDATALRDLFRARVRCSKDGEVLLREL